MIGRWLWLGVALVFWWLVRRVIRQSSSRPGKGRPGPATRPGPAARHPQGKMVRDRVCNTFLPATSAIRHLEGAEEHYFCSETCRSAFLARRSTASG